MMQGSETRASQAIGSWRWPFLLVSIAAVAVISPMLFWGNASGHDFQFHVASWLEVARQWHEGIFYPRWAEWANWGYGEPRFIFYPPGSWILGAALGSVLPWPMVPGTFIWLTLVGGGMFMWRLARVRLSAREAAAAALFFAVNPYNLLIVYYRSDFAELLAITFFPLLVMAALRILDGQRHSVSFLGIVFAAIWLSNAPAAVIATYSLALLLVVGAIVEKKLRVLLTGGAGMLIGFGLAAFYIVPAAWEQRWVQIAHVVSQELRPERNFIFAKIGDPEFILFNWKVSSVALGMMLIVGILAVFVARRHREFPQVLWAMLALAMVSSFLMFAASAILWRLLPKLQFVQFPWRWLDAFSVPFAFFAAAALPRRRQQIILWIGILLALTATATFMARNAWWDSDDVSTLVDWVQSGFGYEGTDEYAPIGCDRYELTGVNTDSEQAPKQPISQFAKMDPNSDAIVPLSGVRVQVQKWNAERRVFLLTSPAQLELAVRLLVYPPWHARIDGGKTLIHSQHNSQTIIAIGSGTHIVDLIFDRTPDRSLGILISILFALLVAFTIRIRRISQTRTA